MKIPVKHDTYNYEVFINADCLCDFCQRNLPDWMMVSKYLGDASVCEDCYDHYND